MPLRVGAGLSFTAAAIVYRTRSMRLGWPSSSRSPACTPAFADDAVEDVMVRGARGAPGSGRERSALARRSADAPGRVRRSVSRRRGGCRA